MPVAIVYVVTNICSGFLNQYCGLIYPDSVAHKMNSLLTKFILQLKSEGAVCVRKEITYATSRVRACVVCILIRHQISTTISFDAVSVDAIVQVRFLQQRGCSSE